MDNDKPPLEMTLEEALHSMQGHFTIYAQAGLNLGAALESLNIKGILDVVKDYDGIDDLRKITPALMLETYSQEQIANTIAMLDESGWFVTMDARAISPELRFSYVKEQGCTPEQLLVITLRMATFNGQMGIVQRIHELRSIGLAESEIKGVITEEQAGSIGSLVMSTVMHANK